MVEGDELSWVVPGLRACPGPARVALMSSPWAFTFPSVNGDNEDRSVADWGLIPWWSSG